MKYLMLLFLVSCSPSKETVSVIRGDKGDQGVPGVDGVSTSCTVSQSENGYNLSCGDTTVLIQNGTTGETGSNGNDGIGCTIEQQEDGALIVCGDSSATVENGDDGESIVGPTGPVGPPGAISRATITTFTSTSCTSLGGGYYGKSSSNSYAIYDDNDCHSSDKVLEMNDANSSKWLSSTMLAVFTSPNDLRVINFN